jgi:heme-degrading monooxygenase HmoA
MIYVVHLYECTPERSSLFASSFDHDGLFAAIGKHLTGYLHTQLRQHSSRPQTYLAIEFWLTEDDYHRARRSDAVRAREEWLRAITVTQVYLGIFLPRMEGSDENAALIGMPASSSELRS